MHLSFTTYLNYKASRNIVESTYLMTPTRSKAIELDSHKNRRTSKIITEKFRRSSMPWVTIFQYLLCLSSYCTTMIET